MSLMPHESARELPPPDLLPASREADLPDEPLIIIEQRNSWLSIDLAELWRNRELLYFLTWRDIKVRYKQTLLGAAWALLQPAFMMLIFTFVFGRLAAGADHIPYPL